MELFLSAQLDFHVMEVFLALVLGRPFPWVEHRHVALVQLDLIVLLELKLCVLEHLIPWRMLGPVVPALLVYYCYFT